MAPGNIWLTLADSFPDALATTGVGGCVIFSEAGSWALDFGPWVCYPSWAVVWHRDVGKASRALARGASLQPFEPRRISEVLINNSSDIMAVDRDARGGDHEVRRSAGTQTYYNLGSD